MRMAIGDRMAMIDVLIESVTSGTIVVDTEGLLMFMMIVVIELISLNQRNAEESSDELSRSFSLI